MSTLAGDPAPGIYSPLTDLFDLIFGPHNQFVRNGITFNDRSLLECYWVDDPTGFETPARNVTSTQNVQQHGSLPETSFYGERTMTLTGSVRAGNYPQLMRMAKRLQTSCVSLDEKPMLITTKKDGAFKQPDVTINCKVADLSIATAIDNNDITGVLKRAFTVSLRASNPIFQEIEEQSVTLIPTTVTDRGRTYDRYYDRQYNIPMDQDQNPVASSGNQIIVVNHGNWIAQPRLVFTGPLGYTTFTNEENGQAIYVRPLGSGQSISIDMYNGDIVDQDGYNAASMVETVSDWMWFNGIYDEHDGSSTLSLFVNTFDTGAKVDITWRATSI
jgi:hypothetical protein